MFLVGTRYWVVLILALTAVVAGVWFFFRNDSSEAPFSPATSGRATSSAPVVTIGDIEGVTITPIPINPVPQEGISTPDLDRTYTIPERYPVSYRESMSAKIKLATETLKADPTRTAVWLDLALYRKQIDDYEGAREIWEYLTRVLPGNSVAFANLGDLYHVYLKDYLRSENYYRTAIKLDPVEIGYYIALHDLYRYSYKKDTTLAADVLKEGLAHSPKSVELLMFLGRYYRDSGDVSNSRKYLSSARDYARAEGRSDIVSQIEAELSQI